MRAAWRVSGVSAIEILRATRSPPASRTVRRRATAPPELLASDTADRLASGPPDLLGGATTVAREGGGEVPGAPLPWTGGAGDRRRFRS
jgi:hypothetical protein